ncbi:MULTISPECIES: error-prone DNA polymerase [unclassified Arthrobacter]|uniref:error-prone DNA polymerase n=1 Tax=unclassified Arthrobacter TaxID=235627 RepID=UPI001492CCB9|nr:MULTISPECIES: error-prone DNA polymerase [unclassified Arthrobacter]MBE0008471.1 error-prone DNA polymerase [Arthrobacter sp. AET 35A]NOJ62211.1 error-prone DNA polymerase [Arthrobacter sp. 147(2020)]
MGFSNPPISWSEFERTLSDRSRPGAPPTGANGGDSPAWSHKRQPYLPPQLTEPEPTGPVVPYAELHVHSNFSFLDGASSPEQLVEEAHRLRLHGLALTDHDGFYGVVHLAEAAEKYPQLSTVFGAELSLDLPKPQNGVPDPEGSHLLILARGAQGYRNLAGAITTAQLGNNAEKGKPTYSYRSLAEHAANSWMILTGCRKGTVRQALVRDGRRGAEAAVGHLVDLFGKDNVAVELIDQGNPLDSALNDELAAVAERLKLPAIATNNVHYASPAQHRLATALAAVRARRSLDAMDGWLPAAGAAHLRSGAEMAARFAAFPGAVERTVDLADDLAFRLRSVKPGLPNLALPDGHTQMSYLRKLVWQGAEKLYPGRRDVEDRIEKELRVIEDKNFPGYFLIVHDLVHFARNRGILCQGRGSAANSAVCYLLEITAVDSILYNLPFERFLSSMRDEEPDIDVDFDSDRREEVIQYVYNKYGRFNAAQVANVITYRPKFAVRDMAKALGHSPGQQDAWSKQVERWGALVSSQDHDIPDTVVQLAQSVLKFPRHLGIHSGGMVLTDRPVGEVCPIEHGRMEGRTVLQWDKDDCAWMGLVKFDLLGLGILAAIQYNFDLAEKHFGEKWDLHSLPKEEQGVYDMLCFADSIGVFQVESRAQMGMLPRLQPREFYDLVIEVALVRPGPIQGGAVHPYIKRKLGEEEVTYLHPKLEPVLERTLGVPLFQEQLMQMAMVVGNCSGADADQLRRAMGSKRGLERIDTLRDKLYAGMASNGITGETADSIYLKIQAFANFGFAESHSISFALLVYASAWLRLHYPGAFLASLLRAQPMGFYSPQTLVADARRHGVTVLRPDLLHSGVHADLEPVPGTGEPSGSPTGIDSCLHQKQPPVGPFNRKVPFDSTHHRRDGNFAVRLGLDSVQSIGTRIAELIVNERQTNGVFTDMADLARRTELNASQLEALAAAGAFESMGLTEREALWNAGPASTERAGQLKGTTVYIQPPLFPDLTAADRVASDLWSTGITPDDHPVRHLRSTLTKRGVLTAEDLISAESGRRVEVGGVVTHRQRPATASGITFMNLEDETGLVNVICSVGVWQRYRRIARESSGVLVRGMLERSSEGVVNIVADKFEGLTMKATTKSRDFQ